MNDKCKKWCKSVWYIFVFLTFACETLSAVELPEGHRQLRYIESTGTQYINTKYTPQKTCRFVLDFAYTTTDASGGGCGYGASGAGPSLRVWREKDATTKAVSYRVVLDDNYGDADYTVVDDYDMDRHVIDISNGSKTFDGKPFGKRTSTSATVLTRALAGPVYLFAQNWGWSPFIGSFMTGRIYSCQIYEGEALKRDFVPCLRENDGKPGLYDKVEGVFYPNEAKTGSDFSYRQMAGVDVSYTQSALFAAEGFSPAIGYASSDGTFTAPEGERLTTDGMVKYRVTGWKLVVIKPDGSCEATCGDGVTCTVALGQQESAELEWQVEAKRKVTAPVSDRATYSPSELWLDFGEVPVWTIKPADGYRIARIEADGSALLGRVLHVTESGDDANDGLTSSTAKRTIQAAIDVSANDDFIDVGPGVFGPASDAVVDGVVWTVNVTNRVTITAVEGPEQTFIDAGTDAARAELRMTAKDAVVAGFTLRNGANSGKAKYVGVYASAGLLSNCVVTVRGMWAKQMLEFFGTARVYDLTVPSFINNEANTLLYAYGNAVIDRVTIPRSGTIGSGSYGYFDLRGNAVLRNTAVLGTTVSAGKPVYLEGNARLEHATIAGIRTSNDSSAIRVASSTAVVTNCIIYGNSSTTASYADIYNNANAARFFYCCCAQLPAGVNGNIIEDPQFVDPSNCDYTLKPLSKCVDHGTIPAKDDPQYGALDLVGNPRVFGKSLDIGAFECQVDPADVPLDIAFDPSATTSVAGESLECTFSAYAVGDTTGMQVAWNFGDGTTSADWPSVTHLYEVPGHYTVTLTVTTATETKTYAIADCITVIPRKTYVSKTGSNTYPYDKPEKAAADLEDALQTHCAEVEVGDGTFENSVSEHLITWPVYVHSTNGKANTTLKAKNANPARHFRVLKDGAGTRISGFTLLGGGSGSQNWHGGLHLEAGLVDHCTLTNSSRVGRNSVYYLTGDARMEDCVVDFGDISAWWDGTQTGFLLEGNGVVDRCRIARWKGTAGNWHCAVLLNSADAVLRNSLVTGCEGGSSLSDGARSSAVCIGDKGGKVENCAITGNSCAGHGAGLYASKAVGSVVNTIIWGNTALADHDDIYAASLPSNNVRNCCFSNPYLPKGYEPNCTLADPNFDAENPAHLTVYSQKQIDAGELTDWAAADGAVDLDGNPRLVNDAVDMGCFEYQGGGHVDLDGTIDIAVTSGRVPFDATFEANLVGDDAGLAGIWDFGDGTTVPYASLKQAHRYAEPGLYTVTLAVENAGGEAKTIVCGKVVTAVPQVCYVSTNGLSVSPYDTWAKAATNVADALELNSKTVLVSNGVYTLTKAISLITDLELKSVNGPSVTKFDGDDKYRILNLQGDGAVVDGFTLVNGRGGSPNALLATKGTLRNCVLTRPGRNTYDRWIEIYGTAVVEDCRFTDWSNSNGNADYWDLMGIYLYGDALMDRCEISQFRGDQSANGVRAMLSVYGNAILRNSIVHDCCFSQGNNEITFVRMEDKARIENCTFANNSITATGGEVRRAVNLKSGSVVNTVFVGNTVEGIEHDLSIAGGTVTHSRSVDLTDGVDGNVTADPRLRNPAKGDYRLRQNSPCVNAGELDPWMTGATDYLGNPRVFNLKVDMGACENQSGGLLLMVK